jgi:hypothetical protein
MERQKLITVDIPSDLKRVRCVLSVFGEYTSDIKKTRSHPKKDIEKGRMCELSRGPNES